MALHIRKCCARGQNININGGSCTDHLAKEDRNGKGQKISKAFFHDRLKIRKKIVHFLEAEQKLENLFRCLFGRIAFEIF